MRRFQKRKQLFYFANKAKLEMILFVFRNERVEQKVPWKLNPDRQFKGGGTAKRRLNIQTK